MRQREPHLAAQLLAQKMPQFFLLREAQPSTMLLTASLSSRLLSLSSMLQTILSLPLVHMASILPHRRGFDTLGKGKGLVTIRKLLN